MTAIPRFVRSWKEHWDPEMELIFVKRLKLGLPGADEVHPGDIVTPEIREALGTQRLKVWWNARVVGSRDSAIGRGLEIGKRAQEKTPAPPSAEQSAQTAPDSELPENITVLGGNWYDVVRSDGATQKVRGKTKALKVAAE